MLEALLNDIANFQVQSVHTDISTKTGERVIVFTLHEKPDFNHTKAVAAQQRAPASTAVCNGSPRTTSGRT
jgi:hypothetical protein